MSRILLSFTLLFLTFGVTACNKEENTGGKAELQDIFSNMITDQKEMFSPENGLSLETIGELEITENGSDFDITFPKMIYTGDKGGAFHLDPIIATATPTNEAGQWDITYDLPNKMPILDKDGKQISAIIIGDQNSTGVWDTDLKGMSVINAVYEDIQILNAKGGVGSSMDVAKLVADFKETSTGLWSGPSKFEITNLKVGDDNSNVIIKQVMSATEMTDFSVQHNEDMREDLKANPRDSLSGIFNNMGSNFAFAMQVNDITVDVKERQKNGRTLPANNFTLGEAEFKLSMKDSADTTSTDEEKKTDQKFSVGYKNLELAIADALVPTTGNFGLILKNFPTEKLTKIGQDIAATGDAQTQKAQALQTAMGLPQILAAANSSVLIQQTGIKSDLYDVSITADIKPSMTSQFKAIGTVNISIKGLEQTLQAINEKAKTATPAQARQMAGAVQALSMVQVMGDKQGDTYILNFQATDDSQLLLNGKDMSALMGMIGR